MPLDPPPMNFAQRLLSSQVRTLVRKPRKGDVVLSVETDKVYEVIWVSTRPDDRYKVRVVDLEFEDHHALTLGESRVLDASEAADARSYYAMVRDA